MAKAKKKRLTDDEKLKRRASKKAQAINAKNLADVGPLFAHEADKVTANEVYWDRRRAAAITQGGHEAGYLAGVEWRIDEYLLRLAARRVMSPEDYDLAVSKSRNFGSVIDYWRNILLGKRRIVIAYHKTIHGYRPCFRDPTAKTCCEHGCKRCESPILLYLEHSTLTESLVWPPEGYKPPMTAAELDAWLAVPVAMEFPGQVDPLGLAPYP